MEHERQVVDAARLPPLLDDRLEHAGVIGMVSPLELLQHAVAAHVGVRRAGEEGHGGGVDVGGGHADDRVHGPGADGGEGQHRPAGGAVEAVGQVHGGLLVHDLDGPDLGPIEEGVGQRPHPVAGDSGGMCDARSDEILCDDLGAGESAGRIGCLRQSTTM